MKKIKKGSLLLLTSGEYSDYDVAAVCRALADIEPSKLRDEWIALHPSEIGRFEANFSAFIAWLVNVKALIEELECAELHIGSYSTLGPEVRTRAALSGVDTTKGTPGAT